VGLVLGLRVRKLAAGANVPAPVLSLVALVVSAGWLGLFALAMVFGAIADHNVSVRVAELRAATKAKAAAAELDVDTACALVEMTLLEGGAGVKRGSLDVFRCEGILEKTADGAVLREVEYSRTSSDKPQRVDACLSRGSRWKVDAIGTGPGCQSGRDAGEE
jgi:hypothetical protein